MRSGCGQDADAVRMRLGSVLPCGEQCPRMDFVTVVCRSGSLRFEKPFDPGRVQKHGLACLCARPESKSAIDCFEGL
jgi:hypothetical protein